MLDDLGYPHFLDGIAKCPLVKHASETPGYFLHVFFFFLIYIYVNKREISIFYFGFIFVNGDSLEGKGLSPTMNEDCQQGASHPTIPSTFFWVPHS